MSNLYPSIKSGTADAILAGIWRGILRDYEVDPSRLDDLVNQYSQKMLHLDVQKRIQYYGNVLNDLKSGKMTWRTFKRGPRILGAKKMTMEVTLKHRACSTTHTLEIEYGPPNEPEEPAVKPKPPTELSVFYIVIMQELGVTVTQFNKLLTTFMRRQGIAITPSNRAFIRGNFKKEILGKRLSWPSFIRGLDLLTVASMDVKITLDFIRRGKKRSSTHRSNVIINSIEDMLEDMKEHEFLDPLIGQEESNEP